MSYFHKWRPSAAQARAFHQAMVEIDDFCSINGIRQSKRCDSYYFTLNGINYRVSNHTMRRSNETARDELGQYVHPVYHSEDDIANTVQIFAGKTRIREIYNDLKAGHKLDGRGNRKED